MRAQSEFEVNNPTRKGGIWLPPASPMTPQKAAAGGAKGVSEAEAAAPFAPGDPLLPK